MIETNRSAKLRFDDLVFYGKKNDSFIDMLCAFFLSISPIMQHYRGPIVNSGITVLIAFFPHILLKLLIRLRTIRIRYIEAIIPLIVFYLYKVFAHGISYLEFAHAAVMIVYFIAIASGCINVKYYIKIATVVAVMASISLILQYFCFYLLGFHLQLVSTSLLLPESERWVLGTKTGLIGIIGRNHGFYRPEAFFLEPSHVFLYLIPLLCILLLAPDMKSWRLKMALLITLGLFLSTSGMGICVSTGVWMLYGGFYRSKHNKYRITNLFTPMNITIVVTISLLLVILYLNVSFFNQSINRILGVEINGTDAISGRVRLAYLHAQTLTGSVLWFGLKDSISDMEFNLSGFFATLFKYGIIGTILSYAFYVKSLIKLKAEYFWLSFIVILISFFTAHTHGTFYMLYYVVILMNGYHVVTQKEDISHPFSLQCRINHAERRAYFE